MKKHFILLAMVLLSVTISGQEIFYSNSAISYVTPSNFNALLHIHYGFIANGRYYVLSYPEGVDDDCVGRLKYVSKDLRLYSWTNDRWEIASEQIVSTDNRLIKGYMAYRDMVAMKDYYGFSKIKMFNDTIVMLITYKYTISDYSQEARHKPISEVIKYYLYNTINIFVPKDNGKYEIHTFVPENKITYVPLWQIKDDSCITKSGDNFSFMFDFGKLTFNIAE
jgi:hypothetical protein